MVRLIDKVAESYQGYRFFSVIRRKVKSVGFEFKANPTIVFVERGKTVKQLYGMQKNIADHIRKFLLNEKEVKVKESTTIGTSKIFELMAEPTHAVAYDNLLKQLRPEAHRIKNISTFKDDTTNKLIVTVTYN